MNKLSPVPFILATSVGCGSTQGEARQPQASVVQIHEAKEQAAPEEKQPTTKAMPEREPLVITEKIRNLYYRICESDTKYKECSKEELDTFFAMEKKVSRAVSRVCMASGDFEEGCIEAAYAKKFGEDKAYKKLKFLRDECPKFQDQCVDEKIEACTTSHKECAHSQLEEIFGPSRGNPVQSRMDGTWEEINPDGTPTGRRFKRGPDGKLILIDE